MTSGPPRIKAESGLGTPKTLSSVRLKRYLVEASVEDSLHLIAVKHHPLDLAALVFVVEGDGFLGGCAEKQRLYSPEAAPFARFTAFLKLKSERERLRLTVTPVSGL